MAQLANRKETLAFSGEMRGTLCTETMAKNRASLGAPRSGFSWIDPVVLRFCGAELGRGSAISITKSREADGEPRASNLHPPQLSPEQTSLLLLIWLLGLLPGLRLTPLALGSLRTGAASASPLCPRFLAWFLAALGGPEMVGAESVLRGSGSETATWGKQGLPPGQGRTEMGAMGWLAVASWCQEESSQVLG